MSQAAWERAMGMRGYAGSPVEQEDRRAREMAARRTAEFPKDVATIKLGRGHYKIDRSDGYSIEVRKSAHGYWYQTSNMVRQRTLGAFVYDMKHGYMARDRVARDGAA